MSRIDRPSRTLTEEWLDEWSHGPGAPIRATQAALGKAETADAIIIVEGISDQIAVETLARRRGRDLESEGVAVLPVGGAQAVARYLRRFGPHGDRRRLAGMCDADAAELIRRVLHRSGVGTPPTVEAMAGLGFHICTEDLEDELIRAVGPEDVERVLEAQGELRSFHTFQRQPEWRGRPMDAQLRRFLGAKAKRTLRYARLLIEAVDLDAVPAPLDAVLDDV
ncbi:MAG: ATP-dependent endonuclease [Acidimicrobiia bacterium]|nr:ATP-dependent endonuclease [Acidimicrobiia bacterium]